ncbi:EthD family reductase [Gordonia sp. HY002]|uniref:EthD family reductase n=1 Tax=Gordonia zhenghanii TaxID=2911516 RepID=UPI001EF00A02|nr:EthD family reductase [Gordonia zhenghanii]MCF8570991.1 EthD family reductase [Gordonia zhenghanii]MCF8607471.1 EthD family reductase [Gordonia zhenghanii]
MYRLNVLYNQPTDPVAFDEYYFNTHMPLAGKIPGLRGATVSKAEALDGSTPDVYLITTLDFDSKEALGAGLGSPEGQAVAADVPNFATGGVTMVGAEVTVFDFS